MFKYLILFCVLFCSVHCFCQQKIAEIPVDSTDEEKFKAFSLYDSGTHSIHLTLVSDLLVRHFTIYPGENGDTNSNPSIQLIRQSADIYDYQHRNYLAGRVTNGGLEEVFSDESFTQIYFTQSGFKESSSAHTGTLSFSEKENLFGYFYQDSSFFLLTSLKNSNTINIYRHLPEKGTSLVQKNVQVSGFGTLHRRLGKFFSKKYHVFDDLAREIGFISRNTDSDPGFLPAMNKIKMFIEPGKVYFTFDNINLDTWVIEVPLDSFSAARTLQFNPGQPQKYYYANLEGKYTNGNSFVVDSILIAANSVSLRFFLACYNLNTGDPIRVFQSEVRDSAAFLHSPVYKVGGFWTNNHVTNSTVHELLKGSFDFGLFGITISKRNDSSIDLHIGTQYNRQGISQVLFTLAFSAMGTRMINSVPGQHGFFIKTISGNNPKNTIFFESNLHYPVLEPLPYQERKNNFNLLTDFINKNDLTGNNISLLNIKHDYYIGYLDTKTFRYLVYRF